MLRRLYNAAGSVDNVAEMLFGFRIGKKQLPSLYLTVPCGGHTQIMAVQFVVDQGVCLLEISERCTRKNKKTRLLFYFQPIVVKVPVPHSVVWSLLR